jgi:PPOX class probable F420-dependent enzyme
MAVWSEEARRFLEAHRVGHLATAGADGAPHVVPVCYALDDEAVYFVADAKPKRRAPRELQRLKNLRENARAALVVDDYDEDWSRLAWVLVRGTTAFVTDPAAHGAALRLLRARYAQYETMPLDDSMRHPLVRIDPLRVIMWRSLRGT